MQITTIGLDIAKNVFQVHGIDASEKVFVRKQLRRAYGAARRALVLPDARVERRPSHRSTRPSAGRDRFRMRHREYRDPEAAHAPDRPAGAAATGTTDRVRSNLRSSQTTTRSSTRRTTTVEMEPYDRLAECKNAHAIGWPLWDRSHPQGPASRLRRRCISGQHSTPHRTALARPRIPAHDRDLRRCQRPRGTRVCCAHVAPLIVRSS